MRETGALETLPPLRSFLLAGAAIGLLGVASFGVAHAAIITPIGMRLAQGIPFGLIAGTGMGWSLYELRRTLQPQATSVVTLTFGLLMWVALLPMTLLSVTLRATGLHGTNDMWEFVGECALAVAAGAAAGALIGRRLQAGLATGLAALAMALAQAGPVPIMNSTRAARIFAALMVVYAVCGAALGPLASLISRRATGGAQDRTASVSVRSQR